MRHVFQSFILARPSRRLAPILFALCFAFAGVTFTPKRAECALPLNHFASQLVQPDIPFVFRAITTFQELYLSFMFGGLVESVVERTIQVEDVLMDPWKPVDQIRRETEAKGDPIPEYKPYDELWHVVKRGQTRTRLQEMYKYPASYLQSLNPYLSLDNLSEGDQVLVWKRPESDSQSRGSANRGRLIYGEPLRPTDSLIVLYQHRVFGTKHTVAHIQSVIDAYAKQFPGTHPLVIGDISFRHGRHIRPHRSHQTGRDADISYPNIKTPPHYNRFIHTHRNNLDTEKTLWLFKKFIDTGMVEYIFVDRGLQRKLIQEAKRQGAPAEWISSVFQYRGRPNAIIRHARGHRNHFHIRFRCRITDEKCYDSYTAKRRLEAQQEILEHEMSIHQSAFIEESEEEI